MMKTITLALAALITTPAVFTDDTQPAAQHEAAQHALIEAGVYGETGTLLGQVTPVELAEDGMVDALIVESAGATDAEPRQVRIEAADFRIDELELGWRVSASFTAEDFAALPGYVPAMEESHGETGSDT